jgi:hypothetical protein
MVLYSIWRHGCIAQPVWHALPPSGTPCAHCGVSNGPSRQSRHIAYVCPLTSRKQPRDTSCSWQVALHSPSPVPRARIMHACAHESSWLLPTLGSLQQNPASLHLALHCSNSKACSEVGTWQTDARG